jgi:Arc/MetJ-type ribon-helix-helix transcriptional regulator
MGVSQYLKMSIKKASYIVQTDADMLVRMRGAAAVKRYKSMSEMVRTVVEKYLDSEGL